MKILRQNEGRCNSLKSDQERNVKILIQNEGRCYCLKGDQERNVKILRQKEGRCYCLKGDQERNVKIFRQNERRCYCLKGIKTGTLKDWVRIRSMFCTQKTTHACALANTQTHTFIDMSLSSRICPPTLSAPSQRFGYE